LISLNPPRTLYIYSIKGWWRVFGCFWSITRRVGSDLPAATRREADTHGGNVPVQVVGWASLCEYRRFFNANPPVVISDQVTPAWKYGFVFLPTNPVLPLRLHLFESLQAIDMRNRTSNGSRCLSHLWVRVVVRSAIASISTDETHRAECEYILTVPAAHRHWG